KHPPAGKSVFSAIDTSLPLSQQQPFQAAEGQRLAAVLFRILALVIDPPKSGTYRDGVYQYHLHPDGIGRDAATIARDRMIVERLKPNSTGWLTCQTPVFDLADLVAAKEDLQRQHDQAAATTAKRLRFDRETQARGSAQAEIDRLNAIRQQEGI